MKGKAMRKIIIDRLVNLKNYEVRWNGGFEGAKKSLETQENEYAVYLNALDDQALIDLLIDEERDSAVKQFEQNQYQG